MIRNGDLPIQIPQRVRAGDEITAKWANSLVDAIIRLRDRIPVESNSGKRNTCAAMPFMPILKAEKGATDFTYKISLSSGYVVDRMITGDTTPIYHFPTGIVDEFDAIIWHDIEDGQCVYVQVAVGLDGTITTDPTVLIEADELAGEHYRPEVFDFVGNAGEHNYKICRFNIVDGKPKLTLFCAGDNIDHYDERVSMINIDAEGTVYEVGKDYDPTTDKVRLRRLKQLDGEGVPIIKDQDDAVINFRRVKQRASPTRIQVTEDGDAILVQGNAAFGTLVHIPCGETTGTTLLEWDDGLVLTQGEVTFEAGCSTTGSGGGGGMP